MGDQPRRPDLVGDALKNIVEGYVSAHICAGVHYVSHGTPVLEDGSQAYPSECRAATVTELGDERALVGLAVLNPDGLFFRPLSKGGAWHDHNRGPGTWHWPTAQCRA